MAVYSGSIRFRVDTIRRSDNHVSTSTQSLAFNSGAVSAQDNYYANPDFDYVIYSPTLQNITKDGSTLISLDVPLIVAISGGWSGGILLPVGSASSSSVILSGGAISLYSSPILKDVKVFDSVVVPDDISANGLYYEISNGDWLKVSDNTVIATAQDVSHLPSGVKFNGWMDNDSSSDIIVGSDKGYYDKFNGFKFFQNLPSGVIPTIRIRYPNDSSQDVFEGSDGNYYDYNGDEILSNLPEGVTPDSFVGGTSEFVEGSDGNYYDLGGDEILSNLPSGVTIVSYDSVSDTFLGSDGNYYDSNGDEVSPPSPPTEPCSGDLLQYSNQVRITVDCEDIFGNQVNIGGTVAIGTSSIVFPSGAFIKKINRVIVRNLTNGSSCGFGNLSVFGTVVGAKAGLDWEGVDIDGVLGEYKLFDAVFQACNTYADIIYNPNFPLGATSLTSLDYGYYCMIDELSLRWEGFSSEDFPYCCDDVNETETSGGEFGKVDTKVEVDVECICENLENINDTLDSKLGLISDKLSDLLCICEKLDSLIEAINNKDLSVTVEGAENNITVEPCSPSVTVTNPVNNITVEPCSPSITVAPCQPTIQNVINEGDVSLDNSDLIDKLDELFLTSNSLGEDISITDVLKNKEMGSEVQVTVEPNELVNYRKVINLDDDN